MACPRFPKSCVQSVRLLLSNPRGSQSFRELPQLSPNIIKLPQTSSSLPGLAQFLGPLIQPTYKPLLFHTLSLWSGTLLARHPHASRCFPELPQTSPGLSFPRHPDDFLASPKVSSCFQKLPQTMSDCNDSSSLPENIRPHFSLFHNREK